MPKGASQPVQGRKRVLQPYENVFVAEKTVLVAGRVPAKEGYPGDSSHHDEYPGDNIPHLGSSQPLDEVSACSVTDEESFKDSFAHSRFIDCICLFY